MDGWSLPTQSAALAVFESCVAGDARGRDAIRIVWQG